MSIKLWLQDNNIEMQSAHSEGKSVILERIIRTLRNKISFKVYDFNIKVYVYWETIHRTTKWSLFMYSQAYILTLIKKSHKESLNLQLLILLEYQNKNIFLQKAILVILVWGSFGD